MKVLLQRVSQAHVEIDGEVMGKINHGLMILFCAEQTDSKLDAEKILAKVLKLRIFSDEAGKMNRSVMQLDGNDKMGDLLIVSQFTLAADVRGGNRPSFTKAAPPQLGKDLYEHFIAQAKEKIPHVTTGEFGADMQIHLVNDGPVTIMLDSNT